MGTKQQPDTFDCHALALPDEPLFTLLARDESAPEVVSQWANLRLTAIREGKKPLSDLPMVQEAVNCAVAMVAWREANKGADGSGVAANHLPSWYSRQSQYRDQKALGELLPKRQTVPPEPAEG